MCGRSWSPAVPPRGQEHGGNVPVVADVEDDVVDSFEREGLAMFVLQHKRDILAVSPGVAPLSARVHVLI